MLLKIPQHGLKLMEEIATKNTLNRGLSTLFLQVFEGWTKPSIDSLCLHRSYVCHNVYCTAFCVMTLTWSKAWDLYVCQKMTWKEYDLLSMLSLTLLRYNVKIVDK